jgi:hypothetical protein
MMQQVMYSVFNECDALRQAGQLEYAHDESNAFANFDRDAEDLQMNRKQVLLVFAKKHWHGIISFVAGHTAQREDVRGRINDLIVYLCLLRGMIDEEQNVIPPLPTQGSRVPPQARPPQSPNLVGPAMSADSDDVPFINK